MAKASKPLTKKSKSESVKSKSGNIPKTFSKGKNTPLIAPTIELINPRAAIGEFYVNRINANEAKTHLVSNVAKYLDPLSSGFLTLDWLFGGGMFNVFASVAGPEQSSKSTYLQNVIANGVKSPLLFNMHIDAESTLNDEYAQAMFAMQGIDYKGLGELKHRPYRYFRENVIETIFDFMHATLKDMPQKIWIPAANSWAYVFDKRDADEVKKMDAYGVKPEKSLSRNDKFICLTEYSGLEGAFYPDSFAAMVSIDDDESKDGEKTRRRAVEASAFSNHLRRISARLTNRGCLMLGANQVRKDPNSRGGHGPTWYEGGGEALKFYSAMRAQFFSVNIGPTIPGNDAVYNKDFKRAAEPSVIVPGAFDLYDYKRVKNTKNKPGNPGKESYVRVWVADHSGNGHGYDPAFDTFNYLLETGQIVKDRRKLKFNLRKSVGAKRAALLNALPEFTESNLKALTLSEVFQSRDLTSRALEGMNLTRTVDLRKSLFDQMKVDKSILAIKTSKKVKDEDYEDEGATEY